MRFFKTTIKRAGHTTWVSPKWEIMCPRNKYLTKYSWINMMNAKMHHHAETMKTPFHYLTIEHEFLTWCGTKQVFRKCRSVTVISDELKKTSTTFCTVHLSMFTKNSITHIVKCYNNDASQQINNFELTVQEV